MWGHHYAVHHWRFSVQYLPHIDILYSELQMTNVYNYPFSLLKTKANFRPQLWNPATLPHGVKKGKAVLLQAWSGLEWPRVFQEIKVPRFHDKGIGWW